MSAIEVAIVRDYDVARFAALGQALLAHAEANPALPPTLVIAEITQSAIVLGRHQRLVSAVSLARLDASSPPLVRRLSGGRALSVAPGTVAVLLVLPSLDSLGVGTAPPDKLMNRSVRGLLGGLTRIGAKGGARYFGRDFLSVESRQIAVVGQDTGPRAGLLEAFIAVDQPLALAAGLDHYPEHGDARAKGPEWITLAESRATPIAFAELAEAIAEGHASAYGLQRASIDPATLPVATAPAEASTAIIESEVGWSESGVADIPVGFVEALIRREGPTLVQARLRGDFLAPAFALRELEQSLAGATLDFADLGARVDAAFHRPGAFIIGLRELRIFAEALLAAAESPPIEAPVPVGAS